MNTVASENKMSGYQGPEPLLKQIGHSEEQGTLSLQKAINLVIDMDDAVTDLDQKQMELFNTLRWLF